MRRSPASPDLLLMIPRGEVATKLPSSVDLPASLLEKPTNSQLLITNGLKLQEIKERVELLERSISEGLVLDQESLKKLARIKEKIQISKEFEDVIKARKDFADGSLSEKYLSPYLLEYFAKDIKRSSEPVKEGEIRIRDPRTSLRITKNREKEMEIVGNITQITKIIEGDDVAFKLKFWGLGQNFEYQIKFSKNKCDFVFEIVFPSKKSSKINLFPEEIQLAMFDKLVEEFPEVLDKLGNSSKINLKQSEIINDHSLLLISKYLHLKSLQDSELEAPFARAPIDHKILLNSSPNQSNSDNFFNQLTAKYNLGQQNKTPPKVVCDFTWNPSVKKSITHIKS
jgi:hypothetical protein